jgi:hypothetical protein
MLIGAMLSALIACGDETTETYARLAMHSNMWESSNFNEDYDRMVVHDLVRLKKTRVSRGLSLGCPAMSADDGREWLPSPTPAKRKITAVEVRSH